MTDAPAALETRGAPSARISCRELSSVDGVTAMLVFVLVLAVAFDYTNGFHDTANSIATSVATRALSPGWAILMATAFNFIGAFAGTAVATTIGSGLVDERRRPRRSSRRRSSVRSRGT